MRGSPQELSRVVQDRTLWTSLIHRVTGSRSLLYGLPLFLFFSLSLSSSLPLSLMFVVICYSSTRKLNHHHPRKKKNSCCRHKLMERRSIEEGDNQARAILRKRSSCIRSKNIRGCPYRQICSHSLLFQKDYNQQHRDIFV